MLDCSDALAPTNEDLLCLAYDEGPLSAQSLAHFEQCSICQQRLATFIEMNSTLHEKLLYRLCPSGLKLNFYCLGGVSDEERARIAAHILDCPLCAEDVKQIRQLQASFEPFPEAPLSPFPSLRRIFARLVVQQAVPVTRGEATDTSWPRQYRAGQLDLSLHLSRQFDGELMLLGILTSADPAQTVDAFEGIVVLLFERADPSISLDELKQKPPLLSTQIDDVGNLLLEPVSAGSYVLLILLPDQEVVVEDLTIKHG